MTRKEELRKPQKVTASAQREDPVAEGTGDSTEAEELPETNRIKTKNKRDRQRRGKKPHKEQPQESQEEVQRGKPQKGKHHPIKRRRRATDTKEKLVEKGIMCDDPKQPRAGKRSIR